jgi:CRP-like cAMP-binding protein
MSDVRRLKEEAAEHAAKGRRKRALECYLELEKREPKVGVWSHRAGELFRYLGDDARAVAAWTRAVENYAAAGFLVKAIAVCQMILRVDRGNHVAQEHLVKLWRERAGEAARVAMAAAIAPPMPPPSMPASIELGVDGSDIEEAIPLDEFDLGSALTQSSAAEEIRPTIAVLPLGAAAALEATPLFAELPPDALGKAVEKVQLTELEPGQLLFTQGEPGDRLYVVVEGEVGVIFEGPPRRVLGVLGEGSFFGEIALVTEEPRSATIEGRQPTTLLWLDRRAVWELVAEYPAVLEVLLRFLRDRLIATLTATSPLFEPFGGSDRRDLANRFQFLEIEPGARVIEQGSASDGLYVLLCGVVEVSRGDGGQERQLAVLGRGDIFGEISLLTGEPAIATVRARVKCLALKMPVRDFREVIMTHPHILALVSELADERRRKVNAVLSGQADYVEGHVNLF